MKLDEVLRSTFIKFGEGKFAINTGWDEDKEYALGAPLNWWPDMKRPGVGIDGVYYGWPMQKSNHDLLVVVSGGKIVELRAVTSEDDVPSVHSELEQTYPKVAPDRSLWPEEVWQKKAEATKKAKGMFRRVT